jgi:leucyl aminopeptidase
VYLPAGTLSKKYDWLSLGETMKAALTQEKLESLHGKGLIVGVFEEGKLSPSAEAADKAFAGLISHSFETGALKGKIGQTQTFQIQQEGRWFPLIVVGLGKSLNPTQYIKVLAAAATQAKSLKVEQLAVLLAEIEVESVDEYWKVAQIAKVFDQSLYRFEQCKSKPSEESDPWGELLIQGEAAQQAALEEGLAVSQGMSVMKDLANLPGNMCTPTYLAEKAIAIANDHSKITTTVLDESELETMGAHSFVSVSKGSSEPGKMILIEYRGGDAQDPVHALVGKGVTFDTGGISLKPGASMDEMKFDMSGAASVFGTLTTVLRLQLPINLVCAIAAAENMPSGNASKPGDIVTSLSGQTIEILNTDAEGRLVLCDTLTHVINTFKPATIVDIATLTGACMAALGEVNSGLFTEDEGLAEELLQAGKLAVDPVWRLPLEEAYQEQLDSNFADMANIGGRLAGATTAACFLSRYTKGQRWAHLDVAGTANQGGKAKGSTGRPVTLLVQYLKHKLA